MNEEITSESSDNIKLPHEERAYTLADLQAAREDMRRACIEAIRNIGLGFVVDPARVETRDDCIAILEDLGPVETRSDIEKAAREDMRRACIESVKGEHLEDPQPGTSDDGYEAAIDDAVKSIAVALVGSVAIILAY